MSHVSVDLDLRHFAADADLIAALAARIAARLRIAHYELGISLVESRRIRQLNRDFRAKDKPTDVLSFPQQSFAKPLKVRPAAAAKPARAARPPEPLGDVVISLPEALKNAAAIGQSLDREVCFLLVHGILHLCGHDHMVPKDEKAMLAEQRKLMRILTRAKGPKGQPVWAGCARKKRGKATRA